MTWIFRLLVTSALAPPLLYGVLPSKTEQEMLHARRVFQFWADREELFLEQEIKNFFSIYPKSEYRESFYAMLGDVAVQKGCYDQAWSWYSKIASPELLQRTSEQRWRTLYHLGQYGLLYQELRGQCSSLEGEGLFYFADSAYQYAVSGEITKQERLFQEAFDAFERLTIDPLFSLYASWHCAEILHYQGHDQEAATLYLEVALAEDNPERLFFAASFLAEVGRYDEAIPWLARMTKSGGPYRGAAAFAWLRCLVAQESWERLEQEKRIFLTALETPHLPLYYFYIGMAASNKQDYVSAVDALTNSLTGGLKPPYDQSAALALLQSAHETHSLAAIELAFHVIEERYPEDVDEATLHQALYCIAQGQGEAARPLLDRVIAMTPKLNVREEACVTRIHMWIEQEAWQEADDAIEQFLQTFPLSKQRKPLIELSCFVAIAQIEPSSTPNWTQVVRSLQRGLDTLDSIPTEQKITWYIQLSRAYVALQDWRAAHHVLASCLALHPNHPEASVWQAITYAQEGASAPHVIEAGEAALALADLQPDMQGVPILHLALFNAYLRHSHESATSDWAPAAAWHLECARAHYPISLENRFWLIHYYAQEGHTHKEAIRLLEETLLSKEQMVLNYPSEAFLLASLYQAQGAHQKAIDLLLPLHTKIPQPRLRLILAISYEALGYWSQACHVIQGLEQQEDATIALVAQLHQLRIQLAGKGEFYPNPLEQLCSLWKMHYGETEPVHLEAALDYIEEKKMELSLPEYTALLLEVRKHFTRQDDLHAKEYHTYLAAHPDKRALHQMYLRWLDIQIYLAQASMPPHHRGESQSKKRAARALLSSLREESVTPYLRDKIHRENLE